MSSENSDLAVQIVDNTSILSYALSLPLGEQRKIYVGGNVTDLPGDYCKYSEAVICKLNNTFAQIVIHPRNSGPMECTNTFNGTTWEGWRFGLSNADTQAGRVESIDCAGNSMATYNVTFPVPFSKTPQVVVSLYSNTTASDYGNISVMSTLITPTGFRIKVANANSGSFAPGVSWIAY